LNIEIADGVGGEASVEVVAGCLQKQRSRRLDAAFAVEVNAVSTCQAASAYQSSFWL
jgi:hypothetical protein